ncbi:DUF983 domain-containing protein [Pustulibacterium marinum]|uniref:DUF983 domain-containing protein n=1 Tax=Pustulibacterium marinum TaxID=1224947 RepID=UPI000B837781|nr:DUF983 domain-containing protein [Pustulibacterium marinum]
MIPLFAVFKCKCPRCQEGAIFKTTGKGSLFSYPKMHSRCLKCNYLFDKEPGFFFGAMFVSYALAVAEFIGFFILAYFVGHWSLRSIFAGVVVLALLLSIKNFKWSRTIWIYMFHKKTS